MSVVFRSDINFKCYLKSFNFTLFIPISTTKNKYSSIIVLQCFKKISSTYFNIFKSKTYRFFCISVWLMLYSSWLLLFKTGGNYLFKIKPLAFRTLVRRVAYCVVYLTHLAWIYWVRCTLSCRSIEYCLQRRLGILILETWRFIWNVLNENPVCVWRFTENS